MEPSDQFDDVSIVKRANIYFDGKCVSHTVRFKDGSRKTLGVIFPAKLLFTTEAAEIITIQAGACRVRLAGSESWVDYRAGQSISIAANSSFDIDVIETLDYLCDYLA
jgi:uncharacterized protein YaiE (UPF0345 family)